MTITTTSSLLGKENNPWNKDPSLVRSYWAFEAGDPPGRTFLLDVTYRNSKKSHDAMVDALEAYFAAGYDTPRDKSNNSYVAPLTIDTAAIQLMIDEKDALKEDRRPQTALVYADKIESSCPLLLSVLRETQRLVAIGTLHSRVVEDTVVSADRSDVQTQSCLLKKGTSILLPVTNAHRDPVIWGPTANEFDANRSLGTQPHLCEATMKDKSSRKRVEEENDLARLRKAAYFPFGGGKRLCLGRYFATTEVLDTMAVLILGYNIRAVDGGPIKQPMFGLSKMTAATARPHPDADMKVQIERRGGWEKVI
ncbi:CypX Cytochrome P450 [Pyrenophora tritici-repentis]|uniref:Cytochrome P450 n=1 Tax=Pyrenophora tritici-repentis TaxID=45151 RepID=A0A2W1CW31_9PLEO|nr:Cytochrome P450 [Pyrenophora tritici-repentis]KAI0571039.1 Cytochrome P450 [Pyrenophora tritici-repentis]KAI1509773.1 Cytochrome P450 [Pyrenophora tritici-repentis]KAI1526239.1 CypX Cytochrome P450 [Pyrenophora tritici-repentis]KAI1527290.1 CypX Cytochrome P450 [Pyrenophora tritici-repentis]